MKMHWTAIASRPIALPAVPFSLRFLYTVLALVLAGVAQTEAGLIGHWRFDENGQGNLLADSSPNALHGGLGAAAMNHSVDGKAGQAIRFPATDSIRLDRHAAALGKLTDFTVSMWIQYDGGASRQLFTFSDGTMNFRMQVEVHNDRLHFGWQNGGSFTGFSTEDLTWMPGQWYHVVFVNDSKAGKSILRSNDLAWKTDANTLSPADFTSPVKRVEIGSLNGEYAFNGCVDDVQLFDSALSLSEQLALYDALQNTPDDPQWVAAKETLIEELRRKEMARQARERFFAEEAPHLTKSERQQKAEWLFQTEEDDLLTRTGKEISLDSRDDRPAATADRHVGPVG